MERKIYFISLFTFDCAYIFNVVFTGLPIIAYAVMERDVQPRKVMKYPQLYESGQKQQEFSIRLLFFWLSTGVAHSVVIFFVNLYVHRYFATSTSSKIPPPLKFHL